MKKEPKMKICLNCSWRDMVVTAVEGIPATLKVKCDLCGKLGTCYQVRACNLQ